MARHRHEITVDGFDVKKEFEELLTGTVALKNHVE
jgi:hypothetical protein